MTRVLCVTHRSPTYKHTYTYIYIHLHIYIHTYIQTYLHLHARAALDLDGAVHHHLVRARRLVEAELDLLDMFIYGLGQLVDG